MKKMMMIIALFTACKSERVREKQQETTPENVSLFDSLVKAHINDGDKIKRKYSEQSERLEHKHKMERLHETINK